jgi:hypothetical protein
MSTDRANNTDKINKTVEKKAASFNVTARGIYSYHWDFNG